MLGSSVITAMWPAPALVTRRPMRPARTCSSSTAPSAGTVGSASVLPDAPRSGELALLPLVLISSEFRPGAFAFLSPGLPSLYNRRHDWLLAISRSRSRSHFPHRQP